MSTIEALYFASFCKSLSKRQRKLVAALMRPVIFPAWFKLYIWLRSLI